MHLGAATGLTCPRTEEPFRTHDPQGCSTCDPSSAGDPVPLSSGFRSDVVAAMSQLCDELRSPAERSTARCKRPPPHAAIGRMDFHLVTVVAIAKQTIPVGIAVRVLIGAPTTSAGVGPRCSARSMRLRRFSRRLQPRRVKCVSRSLPVAVTSLACRTAACIISLLRSLEPSVSRIRRSGDALGRCGSHDVESLAPISLPAIRWE